MNSSGPAAAPPPPAPAAITSLTTSAKQPGSTSLAEALATSVADIVCNNPRKNNNGASPKKAMASSSLKPRVVSQEHPKAAAAPQCANSSAAAPPTSTKATAPRRMSQSAASSMSSAVADLASGMASFQPSNSTTGGSQNQHSAPIISGTAAAVLALQSTSYEPSDTAAAIVSNPSSVETNEGGVPNPLAPSNPPELQGCSVSSPTGENCSPRSITSPRSPSANNASPKFPTRYADGAPIIAGTAAAAQMEAIATATAARITSITNGGAGGCVGDDVVNAVASLGPGDSGLGMNSGGSHGFSGGNYYHGASSTGASVSRNAPPKAPQHKHLSWVDHRNNRGGTNRPYSRVTPEDGHASVPEGSYQVRVTSSAHYATAQQAATMTTASSATDQTPGGGMDILAEIICHAPPMPTSTSTNRSYPQHYQSSSIPSYQGMYQQAQPHQAQSHQAQHHQVQSQSQVGSPRMSAIPSYQEIYKEMGMPQHEPHHHSNAHYSTTDYSVEEVQVGHQSVPSGGKASASNKNTMSHHYSSRPPTTHFGHVNREDVEEGKELYTRKDLVHLGGHLHEHRDVHGNLREGCDSIVLGNLERDIREGDGLCWFLFSTDRTNGGGALCQSYHKKRPIRVFRSSLLGGKFAPPFLDIEDDANEDSDVAYRYDGLYMVRAVWDVNGHETETLPVTGEEGWQTFFFTRMPKKPLEKEKMEPDMEYNFMSLQELWSSAQKMKGVRRPKKFEIPQPPVKLPAMRRGAITGVYKDRKGAGFKKPVVEKPPPPPPKSKSPRNVPKKRSSAESNSSEDESRRRDEIFDDSDSDASQQLTPFSAQSPSKVFAPRPRLNSITQPKKASPSVHDDDSDSSDSEASTSASRHISPQSKGSNSSPSHAKIPMTSDFNSSAFFPKRASAARCEAANRNMFGSKPNNKRKSSGSAKARQPSRASGRKRTKAVRQDDSSSSEDEQLEVEQSILTVGSRVLVTYKGDLFKATIRKRREKNEKHDFLIHYDGNKRTNVHWIPIDRIKQILEINVDTPPKKKQQTAVKKKGNNGGGKRKATAPVTDFKRQQSLQKSHFGGQHDELETEEPNSKRSKGASKDDDESSVEVDDHSDGEKEQPSNVASQSHEEPSKNGEPEERVDSKHDAVETAEPKSSGSAPVPDDKMDAEAEKDALDDHKPDAASGPKLSSKQANNFNGKGPHPADDANSSSEEEAGHDHDSDDNSIDSAGGNAKQKQTASEFKYPVGGHVYVEYRQVFYSSTILKARRKRSASEYLVHYEGYKKSSNRWVKENALHEVNASTTQRFEEQRLIPADILYESEHAAEPRTSRRKKADETSEPLSSGNNSHSVAQKKPPPRRMRSDVSDLSHAALDTIEPGVDFLPGSMVFVEWSGALYLGKMLKKRYSGDRMEYRISYDGYKSNHDAWVSIHKIFEVNPQTKRVFKRINSDISGVSEEKPKRRAPPGPRRETRKKARDYDDIVSRSSSPSRGTRNNGDSDSQPSRTSSRAQANRSSSIDMQGIEPGVEFLPGSTLFAEYKGGLCLAKMVKKRGRGDYVEYFIQYNGLKKEHEAWVSTAMLWEINPQTKRMFRKLAVKK